MLQGLSKTGHLEVVPVQDVAQNFDPLLLQLLQDLQTHRNPAEPSASEEPGMDPSPPPPGHLLAVLQRVLQLQPHLMTLHVDFEVLVVHLRLHLGRLGQPV